METVDWHLRKLRLLVTTKKVIKLMHPPTCYEHEKRYV